MNTGIRTNRLEYLLDREKFAERYEVYCFETCDKYIKSGARILDAAESCSDIKAIKFESGKCVFILMRKDVANKEKLKGVLKHIEDGEKYSISKTDIIKLQDNYIIQLLLNALGSYDSEFLKCNNLTGHLYCFHTDWIRHGKDKNADVIWGIPCLEISVGSTLCLNLNVRTFSSELLKNRITFKKRKFEDYPKYVFAANNTLRRKVKDDKENCFIMRQLDGVKSDITFLDLQSNSKFEHTKMGVLCSIISLFNEKYAGICNLSFRTNEVKERIDFTKAVQRENDRRIKDILNEKGVWLVDQIGDTYSEIFTDNIQRLLESKYGIKAGIGKRIKKDKLNIFVIHNVEYYNGVNDPHDKVYENVAVQHITFEDFSDSSEFALATVIHEVIMKKDLCDGKISLFDWSKLGFTGAISFGIEAEIDDINRYFFMKVHPDGTFEIKEQELTLLEMNEYTEMAEIFEQGRTDFETVKGVIKFEDGRVNAIKETGLFTIPEMDEINALLKSGDNKLRGKERREELLSSCLDIKMYEDDGETYYFVGNIGEGMRPNIQRASLIRKIEGVNGAEIQFEKILPMMNVTFVHNGQLTVMPFPFKYLREYVKLILI